MNKSKLLNIVLGAVIIVLGVFCVHQRRGDAPAAAAPSAPAEEKSATGAFREIDPLDINENAIRLFAQGWFALTAGSGGQFNTMTISWGNLGQLWGNPVVTVYVRPDRYTYRFMEDSPCFTLCAFGRQYKDRLQYFGTVSGRDEDKIKGSGLTPLYTETGNLYYQEARLVIECEKVYYDDLEKEHMLDEAAINHYEVQQKHAPAHRMYIGKILHAWVKE